MNHNFYVCSLLLQISADIINLFELHCYEQLWVIFGY